MSNTASRLSMLALALIALGPAASARAAPQTQPISPESERTRPAPGAVDPDQRPAPTPPVPPPVPPAPTGTDPATPGAETAPSSGAAAEPHQPGPGTAAELPEGEATPFAPKEQQLARRALTELQQANATEVELAQMALERGSSEELKSYASMLIDDHRSAAERVNAFAQGHGIMLPGASTGAAGTMADIEGLPDVPAAGQRIIERLGRLEGERFDRQMVNAMINSQNKTLNKVRQANRRAQDEELKSLLTEMSTTIESHLQRAKELKRSGLAQDTRL